MVSGSQPSQYLYWSAWFSWFYLLFPIAKVGKAKKWAAGIVTLIFLISFVNEFVSKIWHMGQNPAGFFFRFSWLFSFFMLVLAYQAMKQKIVISKRTNCIIGLGLLLSVVYLYFHQYSFISKTQPQAISRFLSKFSILSVLGIAAVTCFIFYAYWEKSQKSQLEKWFEWL